MTPDPSKSTIVIFAVTNCICHDQRVMKIAGTISNMGCEVTIAGRRRGECCKSALVPFKTKRFVMVFKKGFLFYSFFNIRLFIYLLFHNCNLLVSNDLDTLLACFLVSKMKNVALVYDSHEYFTGVPEIQDRPVVKWVWKRIEKFIFPHLSYVMTVSDSIAVQYEKEYGIRPLTIRNCAVRPKDIIPFPREELCIPAGHLLLILQGTGINRDRGGEELIDALSLIENVSLIIVGSGDLLDLLKEKVLKMRLDGRVKFYPKCSWETLMRYTKSADAGLSLDKNTSVNHEFSLPNKVFDYIGAGLPVIASDLFEIRKILTEHNCGILIPEVTAEEISKAIARLTDDRSLLVELKKNALIASESLNWDRESVKVEKLYDTILRTLP
jgi:glycosyltransferase involved in cell wall biosynthesis